MHLMCGSGLQSGSRVGGQLNLSAVDDQSLEGEARGIDGSVTRVLHAIPKWCGNACYGKVLSKQIFSAFDDETGMRDGCA
ncbi:hypothetical protein GCM10007901_19640 [Dyella acidisoli]|uniref:Uncharacterized protein n=1 Tax=Dyella acidisoli TaxID=1867834 RepID=A0ABQ5XR70_9GAMM|nr:hypothetical protein GCM10007901_19640 [Dyella acidisoli]